MFEHLKRLRQHMLTGVSYAIPFIACGGLLLAISIALVPMSANGPDFSHAPMWERVSHIGVTPVSINALKALGRREKPKARGEAA